MIDIIGPWSLWILASVIWVFFLFINLISTKSHKNRLERKELGLPEEEIK